MARTSPFLTLLRPALTEILPVDKLVDHPANIRRHLGDIAGLAASMTSLGQLEELVVRPRGDGVFEVVAGHRRLAALRKAGVADARCTVRELTDREALEVMLVENLQREDVDPVLEARVYATFVADGDSQRQIAGRIGRPQSQISKRLALLDLPAELQDLVAAGRDSTGITLSQAEQLTRLAPWPDRAVAAWKQHSRSPWQPLDRLVAAEVEQAKDAEKKAAVLAELEGKGVRVVEVDYHGGHRSKHVELGSGYHQLPVDRRGHRKLACHATAVDNEGATAEVCVNPAAHPDVAIRGHDHGAGHGGLSAAEKKQRAATRERNRQLRAAHTARGEHLAALIGAAKTPDEMAVLAAAQWIRSLGPMSYDRAHLDITLELCGLSPAAATSRSRDDGTKALLGLLAAGNRKAGEVVTALTFAAGELRARSDCWDDMTAAHYAFLRAHGYQPSPVEAESLRKRGRR